MSTAGGVGGFGSGAGGVTQGSSFTDLRIAAQSVADATASPADTPTTDTLRILIDATPKVFFWIFDAAQNDWYGVEATA